MTSTARAVAAILCAGPLCLLPGHNQAQEPSAAGNQADNPWFELMDDDSDGVLSEEELQVFDLADADDDGRITQEEFEAFFSHGTPFGAQSTEKKGASGESELPCPPYCGRDG